MALPRPNTVDKLSHDVCSLEIPDSEMGVSEADDYILNYCGSDYYARQQSKQKDKQVKKS